MSLLVRKTLTVIQEVEQFLKLKHITGAVINGAIHDFSTTR